MPINDDVRTGETVAAILKNIQTGKKWTIGGAPPTETKHKIEVKITNLTTGEVYSYEKVTK